ncbi:hypothetical protein DL89DRAFT_265918 [Linderina pennispora]|uniref:Nucleolar protein 9 n=1 Tax=Linderina pennispora TaxID=61395 RepID=A0A1Y1WFK5_9FUNG|nr:uncharacterized protein DL89DRAFT_265918 [Linderina pennispora]ORX72330.1 hypothetical protein DL89DRAFT_265918 [Linderina pennispora]
MGSDIKRKTRRGKRGGETKRKAHEDGHEQNEVLDQTPAPAAPASDNRSGAREPMQVDEQYNEQDESRITPASYGLVNPDLQHYLKSCEAMLDSASFENSEDQDIFVNNNFELQLTTDHECSRILEKLFRVSRDYHIRRYFALTRDDTLRLVIHRFSSHVLQSLLLLTASALERECRGESSDFPPESDDQEDGVRTPLPTFEQLVLGLTEMLKPHWQSLMVNEYASHVLRVLLLVLAGDPIEDPSSKAKSGIKSRRSTKYMEDRNGLPSQDKALQRKRRRMLANDKLGSHVLQLMITLQAARTSVEYPGSLLDKLLMVDHENTRRDNYIRSMLEDVVGSHFLEITLRIASPALLQRLYTRYFRGSLSELGFHPISNFVVQSLLSNAKSPEIEPLVHDLLFKNRPGVIRALIESCVRLKAGYSELINALNKGLGATTTNERKELINLLAFLITYQDFVRADYNTLPFKLQGSLILQALLQFPVEGMRPILESYFAQEPMKIYSWAKDPSGSHIVEAIIRSPQVPLKQKRRILRQYESHYADLAMRQYSDLKYKETIMAELLQRETQLNDSMFGRIVASKCKLDQYKRRADEWRERERGNERKKNMFADILDDTGLVAESGGALGALGFAKSAGGKKGKAESNIPDEIDSLFKKRGRSSWQ